MTTHMTARLAWHDDGWNGAICKKPGENAYCIGCKSYPGDLIALTRDLAKEKELAGLSGNELGDYVPPCNYSYNAFGADNAPAASDPPEFFRDGADRRTWSLPPATVCAWFFDAMYDESIKTDGKLDNTKRRAEVERYFDDVAKDIGSNLLFAYANRSNPISTEDHQCFVIVGVSEIVGIGEMMTYDNVTPYIEENYAGGMIWGREVSTSYPETGLRLPYHLYRDQPEKLALLAMVPEDEHVFKMGSRHVDDDIAIGLLEQFLDRVRLLKEWGDESEDWQAREDWLQKTIGRLWKARGLYPGLMTVLDALDASDLITDTKNIALRLGVSAAHKAAFSFLDGENTVGMGEFLSDRKVRSLQNRWARHPEGIRILAKGALSRLSLPAETIEKILLHQNKHGLPHNVDEIIENPYILSEAFIGDDPADRIPWSAVDRAMLPSPDLGPRGAEELEIDDERRLRALMVDCLLREGIHSFLPVGELVVRANFRLARLPDWKRYQLNDHFFDVGADYLDEALTLRADKNETVVYLSSVYQDERAVEKALAGLADRDEIMLRRPISSDTWHRWLYREDSLLAHKATEKYESAVKEQEKIAARLLRQPLSVLAGTAGTGKTSVIQAIVRAVKSTDGEGTSIRIMTPTGKAGDRVRELLREAKVPAQVDTIHSVLASNGWLADNLTFHRRGGKKLDVGTLIVDETSMLDLELAAAFARMVDWDTVQRLVLVGDEGQFPPVGRGRVFADVIRWLEGERPEAIGRLQQNLRQLLNQIEGRGTAVLEVAGMFRANPAWHKMSAENDGPDDTGATTLAQKDMLERLHAGGEIDKDLAVEFWSKPEELPALLINRLEQRMTLKTGLKVDEEKPYLLWKDAFSKGPAAFQILTPHRGGSHGVENLNQACQRRRNASTIERLGAVDGLTLGDKVIQVRNRSRSNPLSAYDWNLRKVQDVEVFNGEIGIVKPSGMDAKDLAVRMRSGRGKRLSRFAVEFARKPGLDVGYGKDIQRSNGQWGTVSASENLELGYAITVHKAQGSEFDETIIVLPQAESPLAMELVYTALTRATGHCTLLLKDDISSLLKARRRENAQVPSISSWLFQRNKADPLLRDRSWYEEGRIHKALSGDMVRSKSEVIIANLLHEKDVRFAYESPLVAKDGSMHLPDFTITSGGKTTFWEHLGMLDKPHYAERWERKRLWYDQWFPGQLATTQEGPDLSDESATLISNIIERKDGA